MSFVLDILEYSYLCRQRPAVQLQAHMKSEAVWAQRRLLEHSPVSSQAVLYLSMNSERLEDFIGRSCSGLTMRIGVTLCEYCLP